MPEYFYKLLVYNLIVQHPSYSIYYITGLLRLLQGFLKRENMPAQKKQFGEPPVLIGLELIF